MKTKQILFLASGSTSRKKLLQESGIAFKVVKQDADESKCDLSLTMDKTVLFLARMKMDHVIMPNGNDGDIAFVITADTLTQDSQGNLQGKPIDRADAIDKLKKMRKGSLTGTGFCLDKKVFKNGKWETVDRIENYVQVQHVFIVPDNWIDTYLQKSCGYKGSGAIAIEEFGDQFSKSITGSYSAIRGLPLFELREALEKIGFFE